MRKAAGRALGTGLRGIVARPAVNHRIWARALSVIKCRGINDFLVRLSADPGAGRGRLSPGRRGVKVIYAVFSPAMKISFMNWAAGLGGRLITGASGLLRGRTV